MMDQQEQGNPIRLVIVHDHGLFRASLARFLTSEPGLEIAAECGTSREALEVIRGSTVNLVLLDLDLGAECANQFVSAARQSGYEGNFLTLAATVDARTAALALKGGASGIFLKSEVPERLVLAIRRVATGEVWLDPKVIQNLADKLIDQNAPAGDQTPIAVLADRERTVLLGIIGGLTNKRIGENMGISESSVKNTIQRLFAKAGVKTRSQLVRVALEGSLGATQQLISRKLFTEDSCDVPTPPERAGYESEHRSS